MNKTLHDLGVEVSKNTNYNGKKICKVFLEALTDANFHGLRSQVATLINKKMIWKLRVKG